MPTPAIVEEKPTEHIYARHMEEQRHRDQYERFL